MTIGTTISMAIRKLVFSGVIGVFLMTGCITTTTGPPKPKPDNAAAAELNYQLGARYYKNGKYELARARLLLSIEKEPRRAVAHSTLALTYEALGNVRLATNSYETAIRVAPRDFDVQNAYAVFLCRNKDYDAAKILFDKAIKHPQNDYAEITLTNAGVCMGQIPDMVAAERYFRVALDYKPNHGEALLQMCLLKFQQEDYLNARGFLQRFMISSRTTAGVLYLAAQIEDLLGNDRGRTEYENRLLREFPTSPEARKVLGSG
ncbi:MAG: type IV pilus biogenesis/stability protein PilW [Proteobacteria bacterium]|nr:type IV pilus biogenesis/stability protein PilW [Pseudomonadota bacterium]